MQNQKSLLLEEKVDFTDSSASSSGAPLYVRVNGELVADGVRTVNIKPASAWKYHKLWVDVAESSGRTIYIDTLKVYETARLDTHIADGYISGRTETSIAPADNATRAEALTILYRFIQK